MSDDETYIPSICVECGMDLTPTKDQLRALMRWGNPIRRQPCLETENGLHRVERVPLPPDRKGSQ